MALLPLRKSSGQIGRTLSGGHSCRLLRCSPGPLVFGRFWLYLSYLSIHSSISSGELGLCSILLMSSILFPDSFCPPFTRRFCCPSQLPAKFINEMILAGTDANTYPAVPLMAASFWGNSSIGCGHGAASHELHIRG